MLFRSVVALSDEQIKPPPQMTSGLDTAYVTGIATQAQGEASQRMLILVDIERLMSSDDIGLLDAATA